MKTLGVALGLAAIISSIPLSVARSWVAPKPSVTVFNQVKAKNDSVIFSFVKFTTESPTDIEVDGSDSAFILEFGKDIGAVSKEECLDQQCWKWTQGGDDVATLTATVDTNSQQQTVYTKIHFAGLPGLTHSYRFSHRGEYLYGGPIDDIYPSNKDMKKNAPYITSEGGKKAPNKANAVAERVWYTSGGRGIQVSDDTPLFVSQDENSLILTVKNQLPYSTKADTIQSQITMVSTRNIKEAWLMLNAGKRTPSPPEIVVKKPLISTWVAFKSNITQEKVLGFVRGLKEKNVDIGVIGVDDGWESCYGSQIFDKKKFPNPKTMVDEIHKLGHKVTLWVHPFVNTDCEAHERLKDHLLKYDNGSIVTTTWWNSPTAGMIDFRNATAVTFFVDRLRKLQKDYGIDGFKFDAGEVSYIPLVNEGVEIPEPNDWTKSYVMMASLFGPLGEVRVGASTSFADVRLRMEDTNSVWDVQNHGLQAVIPAMLQMTVSGYAATIPDFIGGNSYGDQVCDKEMFIRWTQLNTFLPAMQFSILPWSFDDEVLNLTKKYIALHEQYSPYMMDLYYDVDPTPVVAPLWWIDPYAKEALTCTDEFLVGNSILAAPVVEKGANKRDIYFPPGLWKDLETGKTYEGPATVKNFEAPLTRLPWFVRQRFAAK